MDGAAATQLDCFIFLREFFAANAMGVQTAALFGMAYLPPEKDPVQLLTELLRAAQVGDLKTAAGKAIDTAVRRLEST